MISKGEFIDRETELSILNKEWKEPGFRLVIVYGRRRTGKTRLLTHWLKKHEGILYSAAQLSYTLLSKEFSETVGKMLGIYVNPNDMLRAIEELATTSKERLAIIIDEFQYIVEADQSFTSKLQRSIDTILDKTNTVLILSGSSVSFFENELLGYKAPLHGRRTSQIHLHPMRLLEASDFWPKMNPIEATKSYSIVGGTPAYLIHTLNAKNSIDVLQVVLKPGSILLEEAENLLRQEMREPRSYASILKAVATGRTRITEISSTTGIDPRIVSKYASILENLDILEIVYPLGKKKGSRIRIKDPYFLYYYKYITTLRNLVETGYQEKAVEEAIKNLDIHTSQVFEQIVQTIIPDLHIIGYVKTPPYQIGPWWYKQYEIDIIVREPGITTTFIETKWRDVTIKEAKIILRELETKASKTGLQSPENHYVLIAKSAKDCNRPMTQIDDHRALIDYSKTIPIIKQNKLTRKP
ncbi:MAG: ATP-binding protein [Desulfurococcales archaeon]|nr:ATP-binding protein [Desulfurococcales archaeon]